jgi:hypothetical protein
MGGVIIPYTKIECDSPIISLLGPGKGGGDWQYGAAEIIHQKDPDAIIALPLMDLSNIFTPVIKGKQDFTSRRNWELHYLDYSIKNGAALFWFPKQTKEVPGKSYGLISIGELNYVTGIAKHFPDTSFCIGTDGEFTEWRTIEKDIKSRTPNIKIFNTLEETCDEAIKLRKGYV